MPPHNDSITNEAIIMKKDLLVFLTLCAICCQAQQFAVRQTHKLAVTYEDISVPPEMMVVISNDVSRLLEPAIPLLKLSETASEADGVYLDGLSTPQTSFRASLSSYATINGTNLTLVAPKSFTDCYMTNMTFWAANSNKIEEAFAFAQSLVTNPIPLRSSSEMNAIYLTKEYAPGTIPDSGINTLRGEYANTRFFLPSLLGFHSETNASGATGPLGYSTLFKGMLPSFTKHPLAPDEIEVVPIVYYQGHWWISFWNDEEGEQKW